MEAVLEDVFTSEYVAVEFFQNSTTSQRFDLTEEQKFLLRQYHYTFNTFLKDPAQLTSAENTLLIGLLAGSGLYPYTITTEKTASESQGAVNQKTPSVSEAADEIRVLNELLKEGLITQEEFDAKKKELLGL